MTSLATMISLVTGIAADAVTIDRDHHRATAAAVALPGATVATYRALEARAAGEADGWTVAIVPPQGPLPEIAFADELFPPVLLFTTPLQADGNARHRARDQCGVAGDIVRAIVAIAACPLTVDAADALGRHRQQFGDRHA